MPRIKYSFLLCILLMLLLQSCGGGSGGSDTMGVLTMSAPSVTAAAVIGEYSHVSYTVTYTPPPGKSPNGVIINTKITDASGTVVYSYDTQLYSNTSYTDGFDVKATANQQLYGIHLSIGSMVAGSSVIIPKGT